MSKSTRRRINWPHLMERRSVAKSAILLLLTTLIVLGLRFQVEFSIQRTFPLAALHRYYIEGQPAIPEKRACEMIPEESDPDEVKDREKAFLEYLETAEKLSTQKTRKKLPDLIGIGTEKCGTEAVRQIIKKNPMVVASEPSELMFFSGRKYEGASVEEYLNLMPEVNEYQITMEKTPAYFRAGFDLPQRMYDTVPHSKLFLVLCDPVGRTISDFEQEKYQGNLKNTSLYDTAMWEGITMMKDFHETRNLSEARQIEYVQQASIRANSVFTHILASGLYYFHLMRWFRVYDRSQILIIDFDDVMYRPWEVVKEMQEFLGIPQLIIREDFAKNVESGFFKAGRPEVVDVNGTKTILRGNPLCRKSVKKTRTRNGAWDQKPKESTLNMVRNFYSEYNEKLFELLGRRFNWQ